MCPCQIDSLFGQPIQHPECGAHSAGIENPNSIGFMARRYSKRKPPVCGRDPERRFR